ncbi:MAG: hypothetical protein ACWGSD_09995, partial [Thermodesulfobacteriota bacterium]
MPESGSRSEQAIEHLRETARRMARELPEVSFFSDFREELARSEVALEASTLLKECRRHIQSDDDNLGHGLFHALTVARDAGAVMMAEAARQGRTAEETARLVLLVQLASLLHDVKRTEKFHALAGAAEVERILGPAGLREGELARIVIAVRNHEAFKPTVEVPDEDSRLISDVLYDADKFRWGPDNFTHTLWLMMRSSGAPSLESLHLRFLQNLDYIRRVKTTFRSVTGKTYGPEFVDRGIEIG